MTQKCNGNLVFRDIQMVWISDRRIGRYKRKILHVLRKRYQFGEWHVSPINERLYARDIVTYVQKYINKKKKPVIVEIGCGLGSIVGNIKVPLVRGKRVGVDICENNLKAARLLHPFTVFWHGSFDRVHIGKIDCMIMVDFIHRIPEERLKIEIQNFLKNNKVKLIVFDTFVKNKDTVYLHSHRGEYLFDGNYKMIRKSKGFQAAQGARRYIEYWERIENEK